MGGNLIEISDAVPDSPLPRLEDWFLNAGERGNKHTSLDSRHLDRLSWSMGNRVRALIHGAAQKGVW